MYRPTIPLEFYDKRIELFNPYHDERGRFTTKKIGGSRVVSADTRLRESRSRSGDSYYRFVGKSGNISAYDIDLVSLLNFADANEKISADLNNDFKGEFPPTDIVIADRRRAGQISDGAFDFESKTMFISAAAARLFSAGGFMGKSQKQSAELMLIHEKFHSRLHNRNRISIEKFSRLSNERKYDVMMREEALTSMLSEGYHRSKYGGPRLRMYSRESNAAANYFLTKANGNREKAWSLINAAHKDGFGYNVSMAEMMKAYGSGSDISYNSLMNNIAVREMSLSGVMDDMISRHEDNKRELIKMLIERPQEYKRLSKMLVDLLSGNA